MSTAEGASGHPWPAFILWAIVGAGIAFGAMSIMTIGVPFLVAAVAGGVALALSSWARRGVIGILAGVAVPLFYVAYLNRSGPGLICESYGDGASCLDAWNPWPLVAVGIALLITAGVFQARRAR